ncbi:conserved protein of unknown function [Hyphomicrobium sp. 1Nfss2.1]|uniref:hypothetical protein n=1 Tax=Hyphomicrobium sp. 1Nfss2.1 TaxID=3413936 RepID=UPI003C7D3560
MNHTKLTRDTAIQQIKDAIYDLQIGPSEIFPTGQTPMTFVVRFDNNAGRPEQVLIPATATYREIYSVLQATHGRVR